MPEKRKIEPIAADEFHPDPRVAATAADANSKAFSLKLSIEAARRAQARHDERPGTQLELEAPPGITTAPHRYTDGTGC